jgi:hypothetical protein
MSGADEQRQSARGRPVLPTPQSSEIVAPVSGSAIIAMRFALAFVVLILHVGAAFAERRVALVMGADDYKTVRPLENAVNDASAIGEALDKLDF